MPKRKLDEQEKSRKNLLQQIRHTEDRSAMLRLLWKMNRCRLKEEGN